MLEALYAGALEDAEKRLQKISLVQIELDALAAEAPLDAMAFLSPGQKVKIIAEVKRASPSRGDLSKIPAPEILAKTYADNGASAISVLTEQRKFKGSLEDLISVRQQVKIPVLRKDFISNEQQILEARAAGADLVLLIVAGLEEPQLRRLNSFILDLGMTPFI